MAVPAAIAAYVIDFLVNFFEDIFGGGSSPPIPRQLMHRRHPLYGEIIGIDSGLIPTDASSAPVAENRAHPNTPLGQIRPLSFQESWENYSFLGPQHGLLESKRAVALAGDVAVDILVDELTGSRVAGLGAGVAADILLERYYQPPSPLALSFLRIYGISPALVGGARLSDFKRVYRFLLP